MADFLDKLWDNTKKSMVTMAGNMFAMHPATSKAFQSLCKAGGSKSSSTVGEVCATQVGMQEGVVSAIVPVVDSALWAGASVAKAAGAKVNTDTGLLSGEFIEHALHTRIQAGMGYDPKKATPDQERVRIASARGAEIAGLALPPLAVGKAGVALTALEIGAPIARGIVVGATKVADSGTATDVSQASTAPVLQP